MSGPPVLVTGAFGYLGLALVRRLAPHHDVVAFGHAPRNPAAFGVLPEGARRVLGEILEVERVFAEQGPFDAVVHLAGGGGPQKVSADPAEAVRTNVRGATELLRVAGAAGTSRLLYASTIAVYGTQRVPDGPYREDDDVRPDDLYGALKAAAEHAWVGLGGTGLRLSNIYGRGAGVDVGIAGAVERFAHAAATSGTLTLYGTGEQRIDYVHVDDVCDAFERALVAPSLPPVVNIGGGAPISIAELAELCVRAGERLGERPSIQRQPAPTGKTWPDRSLAIGLAAQVLDWRPRTSMDEGLAELVRMMKDTTA